MMQKSLLNIAGKLPQLAAQRLCKNLSISIPNIDGAQVTFTEVYAHTKNLFKAGQYPFKIDCIIN
jgi:hypothetical protein